MINWSIIFIVKADNLSAKEEEMIENSPFIH